MSKPVLTGRIIHRLELSADSSDWSKSGKRPREQISGITEISASSTRAGFFFLPDKNIIESTEEEYILVIPQHLLKHVCDAVRFRFSVRINHYELIVKTAGDESSISAITLYYDGLQLRSADGILADGTSIDQIKQQESVISLSALHEAERSLAIDKKVRKASDAKGERTSKDLFTVSAMVDAISPIIAAIPSDPFAILELYETDCVGKTFTCVAVLKGADALSCHAGILPGDTIILRRVRRQKWNVPSALIVKGYNSKRAPTHVLVVTQSDSVSWESPASSPIEISTFPSTVLPLVTIQGIIVSVKMLPHGSKGHSILHRLELNTSPSCDTATTCTSTLYLSNYPLSSNLLIGLREGAIVRATNVHMLQIHAASGPCYGACLRSTVMLVRNSQPAPPAQPMHHVVPFGFQRLKKSHDKCTLRELLDSNWHYNVGRHLDALGPSGAKPPSIDQVEEALWQLISPQSSPLATNVSIQEPQRHSPHSNKTKSKRDPYAEFFDHAVDNDSEDNVTHAGGCNMSHASNEPFRLVFAGLDQILDAGVYAINQALQNLLQPPSRRESNANISSSNVLAGWTGTVHLKSRSLSNFILERFQKQDSVKVDEKLASYRLFTCGLAGTVDDDDIPTTLASTRCQVPVSLGQGAMDADGICCENDFLMVSVESTIVACLCLGRASHGSSISAFGSLDRQSFDSVEELNVVALPQWGAGRENANRVGACALLECSGLMFMVSIQLRGNAASVAKPTMPVTVRMEKILNSGQAASKHQTIHHVLDTEKLGDKEGTFMGLLTRQRYRFSKLRGGEFCGCTLTLSHIPTVCDKPPTNMKAGNISTAQTIEVKLSVKVPKQNAVILQKSFRKLLGVESGGTLDEQVNLASAWWKMADCGSSSLLVVTGADDVLLWPKSTRTPRGDTLPRSILVPIVKVPLSAVESGSHGYTRFRCSVDELSTEYIQITLDGHRTTGESGSSAHDWAFSSIGGRKILPGVLDRFPPRRQRQGNEHCHMSELISIPPFPMSGVPRSSLAHLHSRICKDLRDRTQTGLRPSLVQMICDARLLSVSFCRARVECTRCFEALVATKDSHRSKNGKRRVEEGSKGPTFWHRPLPIAGQKPPLDATQDLNTSHKNVRKLPYPTDLVCPGDCPLEYAAVKWECSGVLDDGTGQAKLYAERETALVLLGPGLNVAAVEEGAWLDPQGISFQKSLPPSETIKFAIRDAQSLARPATSGWNNSSSTRFTREQQERRVWNNLSVQSRAEYALQNFCRNSTEPLRPLDLLVRCKPLSNEAFQLNRSQVETATPAAKPYLNAAVVDVPTYSVPPLKLNLVDCCALPEASSVEQSWNLVRALRNTSTH